MMRQRGRHLALINTLTITPKRVAVLLNLLLTVNLVAADAPKAIDPLCADREAVERVYYQHRTGEKPPFEKDLPPAEIRRLVERDQQHETALRKCYGIEITDAMVDAEVQRINRSTRAPDTLAELKAALGNDNARFGRTVARPIIVERLLRDRFENDDTLHAPQRHVAEKARAELLAAKKSGAGFEQLVSLLKQGHSNEVITTTWQLGARLEEKSVAENPDEIEIKKRFGPDAQILSGTRNGREEKPKFYLQDLPADLQSVLRVQLRQPGDVSAVVEMPGGFFVYVLKERTEETMTIAALTLPKRSYEQWLADQNPGTK
jgi:hypothetical protein